LQSKLTKTDLYSPAEDTIFFANYIQNEKGKDALDIGTGSGYLARVLSSNFELVVATDISFSAVKEANSKIKNCVCCNAADALCKEFDLVICNMPYLPSAEITDSAVDGLDEGVIIPFEIIKSARNLIKKDGKMIFLTSSLANYKELLKQCESLELHVKIVATKKIFFEELILVEAKK
jgi:release factor glutamine methyltransferase